MDNFAYASLGCVLWIRLSIDFPFLTSFPLKMSKAGNKTTRQNSLVRSAVSALSVWWSFLSLSFGDELSCVSSYLPLSTFTGGWWVEGPTWAHIGPTLHHGRQIILVGSSHVWAPQGYASAYWGPLIERVVQGRGWIAQLTCQRGSLCSSPALRKAGERKLISNLLVIFI